MYSFDFSGFGRIVGGTGQIAGWMGWMDTVTMEFDLD